jgi:hypothetical protein
MLMALLSEQEIAFFRINGYVIQRGAVQSTLVEQCRDLLWNNIPEDRYDPAAWPDGAHSVYRTGVSDDNYSEWTTLGPFHELMAHESLLGVARQMLGEDQIADPIPGYIMLRFPSKDVEWTSPTGGHIDSNDGNSFGCVTLLDEVRANGGGYTVWPGTHLMFHEYFRNHDVRTSLPGGYGAVPWPQGHGIEFTGAPGDVCYVHPWTVHTVGHNVNDNVRMQTVAGYHRASGRQDYDEIGADPWWFYDGMNMISDQITSEGRTWNLSS